MSKLHARQRSESVSSVSYKPRKVLGVVLRRIVVEMVLSAVAVVALLLDSWMASRFVAKRRGE
jgi:hypothetical protein